MNEIRKTTQYILPLRKPIPQASGYDIYPTRDIGEGKIGTDFASLARRLRDERVLVVDGYSGVDFDGFAKNLVLALGKEGLEAIVWRTDAVLRPQSEIDALVAPFLGGDDPLFGFKSTLDLDDFFQKGGFARIKPDPQARMNILVGVGAALFGWEGTLLYLDIPKNEIQFRSRAGSVRNLGCSAPESPKKMYKRFYFADWPVLNRHKKAVLGKVGIFIDAQREREIAWAEGSDIRVALDKMSRNGFRVRPWFEPGAWGGQWVKQRIEGLSKDVDNYAWSFELIVPENGLVFESDGSMLELSFDSLMFAAGENVVGKDCYAEYGDDFPIRMDYLDTFDGGNLSVQCHPTRSYIQENFGENLTQEETYYILDAKEGSTVHIGFKEGVDPSEFESALERSFAESSKLDVERFINTEPSSKHDLFLIPPGTLHSAGADNLVLEISTTPYIFTFKMYDWQRMDLDGRPRPLNIKRAMDNLDFSRQGDHVRRSLVSHPELLEKGEGWELWDLPTHPDHSYSVHRLVVESSVEVQTEGKANALNLVEGGSVRIQTRGGETFVLRYGETFVVSAAAGSYRIESPEGERTMLVKAFMKQARRD